MSAPTPLDQVLARLREKAAEARARLEAGAAAGDSRAQRILRELDDDPADAQVPLHWSERAHEREPGEDG